MEGLDLNQPIVYRNASLRFFKKGECHVTRICRDDVLLLVFEGILRFTEDGIPYEIHPGQYHIQRQDSVQEGTVASDTPKYLYVHFRGHWAQEGQLLPKSGSFDYTALREQMEAMDSLSHSHEPQILQIGAFYRILAALYPRKSAHSLAREIGDFIAKEYGNEITLERLCREFHFSKNHIIGIFKKEFGVSPIVYTNRLRLNRAEHLMEMTSEALEDIAARCGFSSYSHFYRLFVRKNALSPEKWRQSKRMG